MVQPVKIAVISDTHDWMPSGLPARLAVADVIWHLGDVCNPDTLLGLEALGNPMRIIAGNCDYLNIWPGILRMTVHGLRCHLEHIAPQNGPPETDLVLSGHTHRPEQRTEGQVTWLNPGCISNPRGLPPSFAWLEIEEDGSWTWDLELV